MSKYIMTLDEGTTSVRTLITNKKGQIISMAQNELKQIFPKSGWVEHDPIEIWNAQKTTIVTAKKEGNVKSYQIAALGITNQRETIVVWDKETGLPVYNAIVWQDQRTSDFCEKLIREKKAEIFHKKTGLFINPYFSGTKLKWILENVNGVQEKIKNEKILAGTIDTWLMWNATGGSVHATDVSNASRTLLFNIHTQKWDEELCEILNIPMKILPTVKSSSEIYGYVKKDIFSKNATGNVPIAGILGDQQSALFGQLATSVGDVKNTYGTGCFTLVNTGTKPIDSKNKLLTTIAWKIGNNKTIYALEGSVFMGGASIQWLRDGLRIIYNAAESDFFTKLVNDDQRIYVVPSFTGLGAPYWDSSAKGAIFGLERGTKREHLVKATLEGIAYQSYELIEAMENDLKEKINNIKVDGGASQSNYLMQFQSSISNLNVIRPKNVETTAMGAAYMAGLAVGFYDNIDELKKISKIDVIFKPSMSISERNKLIKGWKYSVSKVRNWTKEIE
ncbi:MAG: glycerol kinase GlpK [Mycoplasmatales bacterium]|nr:glycerol kinase GlpK [Mycoplasmatales bacterium]